jgi:hypothetical protein
MHKSIRIAAALACLAPALALANNPPPANNTKPGAKPAPAPNNPNHPGNPPANNTHPGAQTPPANNPPQAQQCPKCPACPNCPSCPTCPTCPTCPPLPPPPKYGTAGCGLGSVLFGDSKGMSQLLVATTNGLFASQLFGISSGTSNCQDTSGNARSAHAFIETNREALAKDMSRGSGETLNNFAALMGCSDPQAVGTSLQKNFKQIFPTEAVSTDEVTQSVFDTLKSENVACSNLG